LAITVDHEYLRESALLLRDVLVHRVFHHPREFRNTAIPDRPVPHESRFTTWLREMSSPYHEGDQNILKAYKDRYEQGYLIYDNIDDRTVALRPDAGDPMLNSLDDSVRLLNYFSVRSGVRQGLHWDFLMPEDDVLRRLQKVRNTDTTLYNTLMAAEIR